MCEEKKYIDYEHCEKIANKKIIAKFHQEIIKSKNAPLGPNELIPVLDNLKGEFNLPRIIRSANVFGCREVFVVGTEFFNPYPAVGAVRSTRTRMFKTIKEALAELEKMDYEIFALLPPSYGGRSLFECKYRSRTAFIAGHEERGLSFDINDYPDLIKPVYIPQHGKIESLNVSVALSIALAEWNRQNVFAGKAFAAIDKS
ncbi:MAG: TrmH family RNA methyltransferase [Pseudomonadota bacterium]